MIAGILFGFIPAAIWIYLLLGRGFFWLARERDDRDGPPGEMERWPSVVAVVPARNEADVLHTSLGSLLQQNYPGSFRIILVDDQSDDGTGDAARAFGRTDRLEVLEGAPRPAGWTGKLWAMHQGVAKANENSHPDYVWLTDADISHTPDNLRRLVYRAETGKLVLTSQMAKLTCQTAAEHFLIPAFVFFFEMLFPFSFVNNPHDKTAAAAGGCMLAHNDALEAAGGIQAIRHEIIDDCALGRRMKALGPVWLGLTNRAVSLRPYHLVSVMGHMVSRSAYAQLGYSPLMLAGTAIGMLFLYVAAPFVSLFGWGISQMAGWFTWMAMAVAYQPMLRFYRLSPLWGFAMPAIGAVYAVFTIQSALQHWRGQGGMWKGRAQAISRP
jgi:hopene-associated glycosyltransferase HpnB